MLAVDQRSFDRERFWGPNTIKPLNFNYEFAPESATQNIWTLTDGLFVSDRRRLSDELGGDAQGLKVVFTRNQVRHSASAKRKKSSRYRHFPALDENVHQKSAPPAKEPAKVIASTSISGTNSRASRITSSGGSLSSRLSPPLCPSGTPVSHKGQQVLSPSKRNPRPNPVGSPASKRKSKDIVKRKSKDIVQRKSKDIVQRKLFPGTDRAVCPLGFQKAHEQKGVSVKLSLEETERLLKSLDFRVRTRKKTTTRERSKSERARKPTFMTPKMSTTTTKMPFQKRAVVKSPTRKDKAKTKRERSPGKKDRTMPWTSQSQLVRSSRQTSSSESSRKKSLSSTSGLGDLLGPLPRVKWTPESRTPRERPVRKRASETTSVTLMKTNKMKAALRKAAERDPPSLDLSEEIEDTSREAVVMRKVRTTPMKIIPKVTINNQLLKSTTTKVDKPQEKKVAPKTMLIKKSGAASGSSTTTLWTPDKVALLDQITSDQQLKAVLMSAGDTYMKSRKYLSFKMPMRPAKTPVKLVLASKKKETQTEDPKTSKLIQAKFAKSADLSAAGKPSAVLGKPSGATEIMSSSVLLTDQPSEGVQTDGDGVGAAAEGKDDAKAPAGTAKKASPKRPATKPKTNYGVKIASKPTVVVKNKAAKAPTKAGAGAHLASGKKDVGSGAGPKRRPKYVTTSKAKERLAQLASEAVGPTRVQSERMAQIRRSNLDTLKKILDKSLSAQNRPAKLDEPKTAKVN